MKLCFEQARLAASYVRWLTENKTCCVDFVITLRMYQRIYYAGAEAPHQGYLVTQ